MCGRYTLTVSTDDLLHHFKARGDIEFSPRYNIAPTQSAPVVFLDEAGQRRLELFRWGLVPFWAKDIKIGNRMINARSETVAEKPAFRASFRNKRCLVPATGFFEWRSEDGAKQPYYIHGVSGELVAFAGLWDRWVSKESGEVVCSYTILTTDANARVEPLHDRMPVLLDRADYDAWLAPDADLDPLAKLLHPAAEDRLDYFAVGREVNRPITDEPSLIVPIGGHPMAT